MRFTFIKTLSGVVLSCSLLLAIAVTNTSGQTTAGSAPGQTLGLIGYMIVPDALEKSAEFYSHLCPAGVYERTAEGLRVNPPNCVDCKATDVLGPRWTPREGGSGPKYRLM